jgi:hypothetical protein
MTPHDPPTHPDLRHSAGLRERSVRWAYRSTSTGRADGNP